MSEHHNTVRGIVLRVDDRMYFIPEKVLESFRVEDPAGRRVLHERTGAQTSWQAQEAVVERSILMNAAFIF